jgi:hypothetical protein
MAAILSWKPLDKGQSRQYDVVMLLGHVVAIVLLAQLLTVFRCLGERVVLSLGIVQLAMALITGLAPGFINPIVVPVRQGSLVLWVLASIISLSMLVSSAQTRKPT